MIDNLKELVGKLGTIRITSVSEGMFENVKMNIDGYEFYDDEVMLYSLDDSVLYLKYEQINELSENTINYGNCVIIYFE